MRFRRAGMSFDYPDDWRLEIDDEVHIGPGVTVFSPDGGLWTVVLGDEAVDPRDQIEAVVAQLRRDYGDVEVEEAADEIEGWPLAGLDFHFISFDLTVTAAVRVLAAGPATYVVFCQADDEEWDRVSPVFTAMTTSLVRGLSGD